MGAVPKCPKCESSRVRIIEIDDGGGIGRFRCATPGCRPFTAIFWHGKCVTRLMDRRRGRPWERCLCCGRRIERGLDAHRERCVDDRVARARQQLASVRLDVSKLDALLRDLAAVRARLVAKEAELFREVGA